MRLMLRQLLLRQLRSRWREVRWSFVTLTWRDHAALLLVDTALGRARQSAVTPRA